MMLLALSTLETDEQRNELDAFYRKYKHRLHAIAFSKLHKDDLAEDAVQTAFMEIAQKPERFFNKSDKDRLSYCAIIVRNVAVDLFKDTVKHTGEELTDDMVDDTLSVEDLVIGELSRDELMEVVNSLSDANRDAIFLKIHYHMSNSEIARDLGINETAVRKRISKAMQIIRKYKEDKL